MTTVGYGDRVPKSVVGRLFAVFWILCGVTITSLMTAALTTAISTVSMHQRASVYHGDIGILKDHVFEKMVLNQGNADKIYGESVTELINLMRNSTVAGILLDSFTAKSHLTYRILKANDMYVDKVIHDSDQSYLGISIFDEDLYFLVEEYFKYQKDLVTDYILELTLLLEEIDDKRVMANLLFTTKSGMFRPTLYTCIVILTLAFLVGGTYELYRIKKRPHSIGLDKNAIELTDIIEKEKKLDTDLRELFAKWHKYLALTMNKYSVCGVFNISHTIDANLLLKLSTITTETPLSADTILTNNTCAEKKKKTKPRGDNNNYHILDEDYVDNKKSVKLNKVTICESKAYKSSTCDEDESKPRVKKSKKVFKKRKKYASVQPQHKNNENTAGGISETASQENELAEEKRRKVLNTSQEHMKQTVKKKKKVPDNDGIIEPHTRQHNGQLSHLSQEAKSNPKMVLHINGEITNHDYEYSPEQKNKKKLEMDDAALSENDKLPPRRLRPLPLMPET